MFDVLKDILQKLSGASSPDAALFGGDFTVPQVDEAERKSEESELRSSRFDPEGQTFAIEYVDAAGQYSRRSVTVWSVDEPSSGALVLNALCHLRGEDRSFRIDRIKGAIDIDGVVYEPPDEFLATVLGIPLPDLVEARKLVSKQERELHIRNIVRIPTTLLSALAKADRSWDVSEVDVILRYADILCADEGFFLDEVDIDYLRGYIRRQRTGPVSFGKAVRELESWPAKDVRSFLLTCQQLVEADGSISDDEAKMLDIIANELIGIPL